MLNSVFDSYRFFVAFVVSNPENTKTRKPVSGPVIHLPEDVNIPSVLSPRCVPTAASSAGRAGSASTAASPETLRLARELFRNAKSKIKAKPRLKKLLLEEQKTLSNKMQKEERRQGLHSDRCKMCKLPGPIGWNDKKECTNLEEHQQGFEHNKNVRMQPTAWHKTCVTNN